MNKLTQTQKDKFWRDGVLVVENAVDPKVLDGLKSVFAGWVDESRQHGEDFGETLDGRPRFDLQPGHSAENPGLRRVQSPEEVSEVYADAMRNAHTVDYCAELIGPAIRFHHGKVNSKLPGTATQVKWHQDFLFQPMTHHDMITCLLFVDEVTLENGPLEVLPGSIVEAQKENVVKCTGPAGAVCLMHVNLLHGSAPNLSDKPRTLYITTYYSEDAIELSENHLPSRFTHELVRGEASGRVRCTPYEMELPAVPKGTSFFAQQEGADLG